MGMQEQDAETQRRWQFYQGMNGIPFRTREEGVPSYKNDDPLHRKPRMVADMHVRQFDLNDDEQRKSLEEILDRCAKGRGYVSRQETQFDQSINGWRFLLVWGDFFLEDPVEAAHAEGKDRQVFH